MSYSSFSSSSHPTTHLSPLPVKASMNGVGWWCWWWWRGSGERGGPGFKQTGPDAAILQAIRASICDEGVKIAASTDLCRGREG
ncbi:hypothetical protein E2C01_060979 [Portunus trituberculatus]|uniref:Uncharacterized protein n=1 Tax=Portunus trituberculatus TaxID=210409 RepID=A0A5B7HB30_PORTR|nr:hypothetical protein [Portunus trituberculatus]